MLSDYKLGKIQKEVKKLHKQGVSKQKIGKYLNKELERYVNKSSISTKGVNKKNLVESSVNIDMHGISKTKFKKIKHEIYVNLAKGKKSIGIKETFKNIDNTADETITDNIYKAPLEFFLNQKTTKIAFLVLEFENYATKEERKEGYETHRKGKTEFIDEQNKHYFYSVQIPRSFKTKDDIKELILQSIALNRQSGKKLRLVNISFRFFENANTTQE